MGKPPKAESSEGLAPSLDAGPAEDETLVAGAVEPTQVATVEELIDLMLQPAGRRLDQGAKLGKGGMGYVDAVVDRGLGRRIARKTMISDDENEEGNTRLFLREMQISSQLDHPSIVPLHDVGRDEAGCLFFTMKLIRGMSLSELVSRVPGEQPSSQELNHLLEICLRVCEAVEFAHSRGVVHGDIKPDNVMVGDFGEVHLLDWGLAVLTDDSPTRVHQELELSIEGIAGTPSYLAPEQASGQAITTATDVFLLGALLYFCLSKQAPFAEDSLSASINAARKCSPPMERVRWASPELVRMVERAMAKNPEDRFESVAALREKLRSLLLGASVLPRRHVSAGEWIIREGEEGREAFVIESGRVSVTQRVGDEDIVLREMGPGEVFGEVAFLTSSPRTASLAALEDCTLSVISAEVLEREIGGLKPWLAVLTKSLAEKLLEREKEGRG